MPFRAVSLFAKCENGAVVVDWVVLATAIVGLGMAVVAVVSVGVEDPGGATKGRLEETAVSAEIEAAADYSGYSLIGPSHDEAWRTSEQARFSAMSDLGLQAAYDAAYPIAVSGDYPHRNHETDRLGVIETEMATRGISTPEGNTGYEDLHAGLGGRSG